MRYTKLDSRFEALTPSAAARIWFARCQHDLSPRHAPATGGERQEAPGACLDDCARDTADPDLGLATPIAMPIGTA